MPMAKWGEVGPSRLSCAIGLILLLAAKTFAQELPVTVLGPPDYPPYSYSQDGLPIGIYPDIFAELSDRIEGYRIEIELQPWKRALVSVEMGTHIAVYPPYHWPEQRPWMTAYSEPILQERIAVFCRPDVLEEARPRWPEDYFGLNIGVDLGNLAPGPSFFDAVEAKHLTQISVPLDSLVPHLLTGTFDCAVQDSTVIHYYYHRYAEARNLGAPFEDRAVEGVFLSNQWAYLGFGSNAQGMFPYQKDFIAKLNAGIRAMRQEGRIDAIIAHWD